MQLEAHAKINWSLDITGVREDGYHLMDMLMQPISLSDTVTLLPGAELTLHTEGHPRLPADEHHLALRAARLLQAETGCSLGADITVYKRIPVGAGLGGGSADAAAVLAGLNRLWGTGLTGPELETLGLKLGADVPFCLRGGLVRTRGIGELMEPLPCDIRYSLIVLQPCKGLSTREVFTAWHASPDLPRPDTDLAAEALRTGNLSGLKTGLKNVLQPVSVSLRPEIGRAIRRLKEYGADTALMTGSGSAVFGVFRSPERARTVYPAIKALWRNCHLCHTQKESVVFREPGQNPSLPPEVPPTP